MKPTIVPRRRNGLELIGADASIPQSKWQNELRLAPVSLATSPRY
jgi:hypothetical protein